MPTPTDFDLQAPSWRPYQYETVQWAREPKQHNGVYVAQINEAPTGCHAKGELILMANGSLKKVEDIAIGDEVLSMRGVTSGNTVRELHRGNWFMYRITADDGTSFVVNEDHLLTVYLH